MLIADSNNELIGTLCTGIFVNEINKKINTHFDSRYLDSVSIHNLNYTKNYFTDIEELTKNVKNNFFKNDQSFFLKSSKYPFIIEIKARHSYIKKTFYSYVAFTSSICFIAITCFYFINKYFKNPLTLLGTKLKLVNNFINSNNSIDIYPHLQEDFSLDELLLSLDKLIDEKYQFFVEGTVKQFEESSLKKKILNLIFIEQHYFKYKRLLHEL